MSDSYPRILSAACFTALLSIASITGHTQGFTTVYSEDFEDLSLGPNVDEGVAGSAVWTKTPPPGWVIDDSGVPGVGNDATDGVTEWAGWSFADKDWWASTAGDQDRSRFDNAVGTVAIADPDEWDDQTHSPGTYNTFLTTPAIDISGVPNEPLFVAFDSSWRPDGTQVATLTVSYDGGASVELLRRESNSGSANYYPDAPNESLLLPLNPPGGTSNMVLTFGLTNAGNNWWWAFDNLQVVYGAPELPEITQQPQDVVAFDGCSAVFSVEAKGLPISFQWFKDGQAISGANSERLTISSASVGDEGAYYVEVSNGGGTVVSDSATLAIGTDLLARPDSPFGNKRVLLIGIDGCRVDSFLRARTPNLDALAARGSYSWTARCSIGQGTVSGPGWSTILTGVWVDKHNVSNNGFSSPNYDAYPHFFTRLREAHPNAYLSSLVNWSPINQQILRDEDFQLTGLSDEQVGSQAACHILSAGPDAVFLHFDELDGAGHATGFDPTSGFYLSTLVRLDGYIGTVLEAVDQRTEQLGEDWLVIICSDHGGTPGGSHGGLSLDELKVPLIVSGGTTPIGELPGERSNADIVPTIYAHLGIEVPASWNLDGQTTGVQPELETIPAGPTSPIFVRWPGTGTLQRATSVTGPWIDIPNGYSPFPVDSLEDQEFYRLAP